MICFSPFLFDLLFIDNNSYSFPYFFLTATNPPAEQRRTKRLQPERRAKKLATTALTSEPTIEPTIEPSTKRVKRRRNTAADEEIVENEVKSTPRAGKKLEDTWSGYSKGDCVLLRPTDSEWVHYVNNRFVDYLRKHKIQPRKKQEKMWLARVVGFRKQSDGEWLADVQHFWYPENTFLYFNEGLHPKLVFLVEEVQPFPASNFLKKCDVCGIFVF